MTVDPMTITDPMTTTCDSVAARPPAAAGLAPFRARYAPADEDLAQEFLATAPQSPKAEARIDARAGRLVTATGTKESGVRNQPFTISTPSALATFAMLLSKVRSLQPVL
jgi:hypothetical protein